MYIKYIKTILPLAFLLSACVIAPKTSVSSASEPAHAAQSSQTDTDSLPYPEPDFTHQLEQLSLQVSQLQQHIDQINTRIEQLEQRIPRRKTAPQTVSGSLNAGHTDNTLSNAQKAYQTGNDQQVLQYLRGADNGGNGSEAARQKMYLLLQSHQRLGNCQSVIQIAQRYAALYAQKPHADEALWMAGQCQWQIQQRDIARETWRKLIRLYPQSHAAQRAAERL